MSKCRAVVLFLASFAFSLHAATTITVSNSVVVPQVKRFGISGMAHLYYDRVHLKDLAWRNGGFEGLYFQSIVRCANGTSNACVDDNPFTQWPDGFFNGGEFEVILGASKGRTGSIETFITAPRDGATGSTWTFGGSATPFTAGTVFIARKAIAGNGDAGWTAATLGSGTVTTETVDLPPGTAGRQCLRLTAPAVTDRAAITGGFGAHMGRNFVLLDGRYRLSFKARRVSGVSTLAVSVTRGATQHLSQNVTIRNAWESYALEFDASESPSIAAAFVSLAFTAAGSTILLDDVSLTEVDGDPANGSPFRDDVVAAIRSFNPGNLRADNMDLAETLEDRIGEPFGRRRTEYSVYATTKTYIPYGWHEFLELCEEVGAEPHLVVPTVFTEQEARNLIEYLAGPVNSTFGARRAARGHAGPWTEVFPKIHLEFGNEPWNPVFRGVTMLPADYGARGDAIFRAMRSSPHFAAAKFNLILNSQSSQPANTRTLHNASASHDSVSIAPYMATRIDDYSSEEQLFGGLFAESVWWSSPSQSGRPAGFVRATYDVVNATSRPVPLYVYEVNLHTTEGSIPQQTLDAFAPSAGAGLAVANHMLTMLREFRLVNQCLFSLGGYRHNRTDNKTVALWAITRDIGVTDRRRPTYLALKLANEALAGDLVQTTHTGDDPRWSQPLTNRIQLDNVSYLRSFAFTQGGRRSLIVFNLHRSSSLDVNVTGPSAPAGSVVVKRLSAARITDSNEESETVSVTSENVAGFGPSTTLSLPPFSMTLIQTVETGAPRRRVVTPR